MRRAKSHRIFQACAWWLVASGRLLIPLRAQDSETVKSKLPPPDHANVAYGPNARNELDVWLAKAERPAPVLIYFHGGGFVAGSKENLPAALLAAALRAGITVVAANYRLSPAVVFPTHYLDCARAIQFTRHAAAEWNIDPHRVALTGSSAGGATSLWLAFHDDLADPTNADPVLRESTRVTCAAVIVAQPTYDPRIIRQLVGESAARHPVFTAMYGLKPAEADTERAHRLYAEAAPITYLTPDDPPVFAYYGGSSALPPPGAKAGEGIHHPLLGVYLKEKMDAVKVECVLRRKEDGGNVTIAEVAFLQQHLGLASAP
jgi:acetyl esterase/lipase